MPQAARVGDQVSHTEAQQQAVGESLKGALFGVLIGVAIVGLTVATGGADLVVAGAVVAAGGTVLGMAGRGFLQGEKEGAQVTTPEGPVLTGSGNVTVNGRAAAIACGSDVACKEHGPGNKVAQGSRTVSINGKLASRVGDMGTCGFVIGQGSDTVTIGGPVGTCAAISKEVPDWENTLAHGAIVVGDAAVLVGSVMSGVGAVRGILAAPAALRGLLWARFGAGMAGGLGFGAGGGYVGGKVFGQGSWQQEAMATGGGLFGGALGGGLVRGGETPVPEGVSPVADEPAPTAPARPDLSPEENFPGQQTGNNCAPQSCQQVIRQATGPTTPRPRWSQIAQGTGAYDPASGTRPGGEADILNAGGVPAHTQPGHPRISRPPSTTARASSPATGPGTCGRGDPNYMADPDNPDGGRPRGPDRGGGARRGRQRHALRHQRHGHGHGGALVPADQYEGSLDGGPIAVTDDPFVHRSAPRPRRRRPPPIP